MHFVVTTNVLIRLQVQALAWGYDQHMTLKIHTMSAWCVMYIHVCQKQF